MSDESLRGAQQLIEEAIKSLLEPHGLQLEKPLRWSRFPKTTLFIVEGRVRGRELTWSISQENLLAYSTSAEIRSAVDAYVRKVIFGA